MRRNQGLDFLALHKACEHVLCRDCLLTQIGTELSGVLGSKAFLQLDVRIDYRDGLVDFEEPGAGTKIQP